MKKILTIFSVFAITISNIFIGRGAGSLTSPCSDVHIIWARGSGQEMGGRDYQAFKKALSVTLSGLDRTFSFHELDYEAIGLDFGVIVRAKYSKGEGFDYGGSVIHGANRLRNYISDYARWCPNTKFVIGGYSQGAQVISTMLRDEMETGIVQKLADRIVYAATIADP